MDALLDTVYLALAFWNEPRPHPLNCLCGGPTPVITHSPSIIRADIDARHTSHAIDTKRLTKSYARRSVGSERGTVSDR